MSNTKLDDETLEMRDAHPKHEDDENLETRDRQRPQMKNVVFRHRNFPSAGEMQQSAPLALAKSMSTSSAVRLLDID